MQSAPYILTTLEYKLSLALYLPYNPQYPLRVSISNDLKNIVLRAICHQNIIGWDNFFKRIHLLILERDPNGMYHGFHMSELGCQNGAKRIIAIPILVDEQEYFSSREFMERIERKIASTGDRCSDKDI
jgi:hypothetical protein